ncbi:MAG TPA: c-type cytochrome, partial [Terriglobia bacterium]|nr:c-type cytochrome [Terriglobia bacterium]
MKAMLKDRFFHLVSVVSLVMIAVTLSSGGLGAQTGATAPAEVTFTKDVAPILQRSCQSCHRPDNIAPMPLLTYEQARPWARSIKEKVVLRVMPPWYVDPNVGIRKFKNDGGLSDQEIATIVKWVDSGAPRGNPA